MRNVVIVAGARTAGGSFGGQFMNKTAIDLGAAVIKNVVDRAGIPVDMIDQVIFGNAWQAGVGPNPARLCTLKAGLSEGCPAFTVNMRCGSGLRTVQLAALSIAAGESEVVVAGGTESTTNVPHIMRGARWGVRKGEVPVTDTLTVDGYFDPISNMIMGNTAEKLCDIYSITQAEADEFAIESQRKAAEAFDAGAFNEELAEIVLKDKKGNETVASDEVIRRGLTMEKLAKLPPAFKKEGRVTAGNSCALCDAASAVVLMSEEKAAELGIKPLARIISYSYVALDPTVMGLGPARAIPEALKKAGLTMDDIDLFEVNEAFAAQVIACDRELHFPKDKLNVNGGAIALGHPVAATGAKILVTLLYALKNRGKRFGCVSLCIGGGQGVAMVVENLFL